MSGVFESINLGVDRTSASRIASRIASSRLPKHSYIESSDDEDINPAELVLPRSLKDDTNEDIPEHEFFSNPSMMISKELNSQHFTPQHFTQDSSETPLQFLTNKTKIISKELDHNVQNHKLYLENGDSRLDRVRSMIGQNFEQLSEGYYSMNELYLKEIDQTERMFRRLEKWDKKRNHVLDKIKHIKSPTNKHGTKLSNLLDKSHEIDSEISQLEVKLANLRAQKVLINAEIDTTSSVLESKTSKYVELFKGIENQGKQALLEFFNTSGSPMNTENLIRSIPVNITFMDGYMSSSTVFKPPTPKTTAPMPQINIPKTEAPKPISKPIDEPEPIRKSTMGIQPFVIPETPISVSEDHKKRQAQKKGDDGSQAYEAGFERGAVVSSHFKQRMGQLMKLIAQLFPDHQIQSNQSIVVDDTTNTISEKLDLDPIITFLDHKVSALSSLTQTASKDAAAYHEYSLVWKDITDRLKSQEALLSEQVADSISSRHDLKNSKVSDILVDNLNYIRLKIQSLQSTLANSKGSPDDNFLYRSFMNETQALVKALTMISNDNSHEKVLGEFKELSIKKPRYHDSSSFRKPNLAKAPTPTTGINVEDIASSTSGASLESSFDRTPSK